MNLLTKPAHQTVRTYHNFPISFELVNGHVYANATEVCKAFNTDFSQYARTQKAKEYLTFMSAKMQVSENQMIITKNGSPASGGGTWLHEKLILDLCRWLSNDLAYWMDERIAELMRTGKAELVPQNQIPRTLSQALFLAAQQAELIEKQGRLLEEAGPKLATYQAVINSTGYFSMQEAAKALGIGPKQIFAILRQRAILYFADGHNLPYQKYIDRGWFVMKVGTFTKDGKTYSHPRVYATPKGVEGLNDLLNR